MISLAALGDELLEREDAEDAEHTEADGGAAEDHAQVQQEIVQ